MAGLRPFPHRFSAQVYTFDNVKGTPRCCEHIGEVIQPKYVKAFRERRRKPRCLVSGRLQAPAALLLQKALHIAYRSVSMIHVSGSGSKQRNPTLPGNRAPISNLQPFASGLNSPTDVLQMKKKFWEGVVIFL
jgi:hypothetical protein